jgi:GNAT superfamily N-acetyltransferase
MGAMTFDLRELGEDDVGDLQELLESDPCYTERITGYAPGPSDALSVLIGRPEGLQADHKFGFGLWDAGRLLAFADVLRGHPNESTAYIGLLIVHGRRHGKGLGRALHHYILQRCPEWPGIETLRLGVVATNAETAEPFWRALGYEPTGETRPYRYDKLESTVDLWERRLDVTGP